MWSHTSTTVLARVCRMPEVSRVAFLLGTLAAAPQAPTEKTSVLRLGPVPDRVRRRCEDDLAMSAAGAAV